MLFTTGCEIDELDDPNNPSVDLVNDATLSELQNLIESLVEKHGPGQRGFLGSTRYEVLDSPDMLVEIAEWESAEARVAHMEESAATGAYADYWSGLIVADSVNPDVNPIRASAPADGITSFSL